MSRRELVVAWVYIVLALVFIGALYAAVLAPYGSIAQGIYARIAVWTGLVATFWMLAIIVTATRRAQ